jgi:hypothetical protein
MGDGMAPAEAGDVSSVTLLMTMLGTIYQVSAYYVSMSFHILFTWWCSLLFIVF